MNIDNHFVRFVLASVLALPATAQVGPSSTTPAKPPVGTAVQAQPAADVVRAQLPSYPLKTCAVGGEELGKNGPIVDHVVQGRLVRLCCNDCAKELEKDPAAVIKKIDAAVVAAQKPSYPLMTCPVTGEKLADKAVDHVHGTRLVRLANADVVAKFAMDPKASMAKVDKAYVEALRPKYTRTTCIVTDEAFGGDMGEPIDYLYGTTLVRFCCKSCVRKFEKDPEKYAKLAK